MESFGPKYLQDDDAVSIVAIERSKNGSQLGAMRSARSDGN